jgi:tetratricopeptide (TPR) repeat protein
MSLIHKALNKVEKKSTLGVDQASLVEEQLIEEKAKSEFLGMPLRTIVLVVLVILAGIFAIYLNFFMDDKKKSATKPEEAATNQVQSTAAVPKVPTPNKRRVAGVSKSAEGAMKYSIPVEAQLINNEARNLFQSGELDLALVKFDEALELAPNNPDILNSIGLVYKKKGSQVIAKQYYEKAIKYGPECSECYNNLGVLDADLSDTVAAVLHLRKAISISEAYADPYFNLAVIMEKEGNLKSAVKNYKTFLIYTNSSSEELKKGVRERIEKIALQWEDE